MWFLNPALLVGGLLFAVPLIIHLLNRQRHRRRPWAAMEFLLRAFKKQRRRLRRENLLLLLLRCLIPVLLALALARPVLQEATALLGQGTGLHHVVVLDGSYSMGLRRDGVPSPFESARGMAVRLLDRLQGRRERNDKVTLVVAGVRTRVLARGDLDLVSARNQLQQLQKTEDAAADLTDGLTQVAELIEEGADPDVRVYVLTDLQARSFGTALQEGREGPAAPEFKDTMRDVVERLRGMSHVRLRFIDVGPMAERRTGGTAENAQITGLRVDQPAAVARVPVTVHVTLRNRGLAAASTQVMVEVDGGEPMRKLATVEAGAEADVEFQVVFRETGRHRLRASLANDALEADDERFCSVEVRERIRVLVVDGAADEEPLRTHGWLFRSIVDPTGGGGPPELTVFDVQVCDTLALLSGQQSPATYDVTVLADVDRINERGADGIRRALQAGKGLLCTLGERADAQSWNLQLYGAGDGPMPFRLLGVDGATPGSGVSVASVIDLPDHPLLAEFDQQVYREILQMIPVWRWHGVAAGSLREGAQVPLRLSDAQQSPLLVAAPFGEGKVVFWLSAPGSEYRPERWNRFEDRFVRYQLFFGILRWLSLPWQDPFHVAVGGSLGATVPARPEALELIKPDRDGGGKVPVSEDSRPLTSGRYALPPWPHTEWAGFYTFECLLDREAGKERASFIFAVNVDTDEGELRYAAHEDVREALGVEPVLTGLPSEEAGTVEPERSELGPTLLFSLLVLVLGEAAMARSVSLRRD